MTDQPKRAWLAADSVGAPLRLPLFRRIWLASLLSNLGLLIQGVGAAWAMTQMTASADQVALVQTALMLPIMLISMPAGAIADMYDRRIVALVSLGIALSGATTLSVLAWLNLVTPQKQHHHQREIEYRVAGEGRDRAGGRYHDAADGRPETTRDVVADAVQRHRRRQCLARYLLADRGLPCRPEQRIAATDHETE